MSDHPAPNPNQPAALVEKAARLLRRVANRWDADYDGWESLDDEYREDWRRQARAVLAAVLPEVERHAKADAFDEGWIARSNREPVYRLNDGLPPHRSLNPYREKGDDR